MRIIAGSARGRRIEAPPGRQTRPTADRVREALFSIVEARLSLERVEVLDLFAGSGALGLEAVSRGASRAVLVDREPGCRRTIVANARRVGLEERCQVLQKDVAAALGLLAREGARFQLILVDPPYSAEVDPILGLIGRLGLLHHDGLLVLEHAARLQAPRACSDLQRLAERRYGDTCLTVYAPAAE